MLCCLEMMERIHDVCWKHLNFSVIFGSSIMTMPLLMMYLLPLRFWLKHLWQYWTTFHIYQIWTNTSFGYSRNWQPLWKANGCEMFPALRDMQRQSWRAFQKRGFRNVVNSENAYSLNVLLCEETALNVTGTTSV